MSKTDQAKQSVELADVWADPPVEELGATVRTLSNKAYLRELSTLQIELVKLQEWITHEGIKVVVLFEGRDAAGKGGASSHHPSLNPRYARVVALGTPTEREKTQWYFQRYVAHLPAAGEMVLFDRSWYNRAGVERVMGFCTEEEYREFMRSLPRVRADAHPLRHRPRQVLVLGQRRGAGASLPEADRGPDQALEAEPDGPRVARPWVDTRGPRTRCSRTPTSSRRRGTWSTPTTRSAPG